MKKITTTGGIKYHRTRSGAFIVKGPQSKCNFCGKWINTDAEQNPYVCRICRQNLQGKQTVLVKHWKKKGLIP